MKNYRLKGISLIVLIITIIVIIIFAGVVIISLNNTNIINNSNLAVKTQDKSNIIDTYNLAIMDMFFSNKVDEENVRKLTISELYDKTGKDLKDKFFIDENNNLNEKQEDGSYKVIVEFPGELVRTENLAPRPAEWNSDGYNNKNITSIYVKNGENEKAIIPLPDGFVVSRVEGENDITTGVVIYQIEKGFKANVTSSNHKEAMQNRNQYVWVPVPDVSKYKRTNFTGEYMVERDFIECLNEKDLPEGFTLNKLKTMIEKYKGFYIARYESGKQDTDIPVVRQNKKVYSKINYFDSVLKAKTLLNIENNVMSGLTTGAQWDMALKFIETKNLNYGKDSTGKGNYIEESSNNAWKENMTETGRIVEYSTNNIYDMAGNAREWTNEYMGESRPLSLDSEYIFRASRGGDYTRYGSSESVSAGYRDNDFPSSTYEDKNSFRVSLYMK